MRPAIGTDRLICRGCECNPSVLYLHNNQRRRMEAQLIAAGFPIDLVHTRCTKCLENMLLGASALLGTEDFEYLHTLGGPCRISGAWVRGKLSAHTPPAKVEIVNLIPNIREVVLVSSFMNPSTHWAWQAPTALVIEINQGNCVALRVSCRGLEGRLDEIPLDP